VFVYLVPSQVSPDSPLAAFLLLSKEQKHIVAQGEPLKLLRKWYWELQYCSEGGQQLHEKEATTVFVSVQEGKKNSPFLR
jgi:hypothetical protein